MSPAAIARAVLVAMTVLICWGMLAPQDPMPKYFGHQDKLEHLAAFAILGAAASLTISRRLIWIAAAFCVAAAIGLEFGQAAFTLHREPSWKDAFCSIVGAMSGVSAIAVLRAFAPALERA